ncbi:hypothetical protein K504DRAFT_247270 [Pleomassaria siparia CBS 279.74]|uniref:Secreted protein n=1 Tax=Pleomassaria siparia CBS 279.74 TaxID=1314801 RepID=A0A6G1KBV5_9PLEO|nr:hypothetical protein K504DRAFT_247270 [Pleomassaria siparia CBS 279.74]
MFVSSASSISLTFSFFSFLPLMPLLDVGPNSTPASRRDHIQLPESSPVLRVLTWLFGTPLRTISSRNLICAPRPSPMHVLLGTMQSFRPKIRVSACLVLARARRSAYVVGVY